MTFPDVICCVGVSQALWEHSEGPLMTLSLTRGEERHPQLVLHRRDDKAATQRGRKDAPRPHA